MSKAREGRVPDARSAEGPDLAERLGAFQSLGGNCEFGFVQRSCGAEPSGLLRFTFTPLEDLIHALSTDFAEYGAPGDLRIEETETHYYYCASRHYNFWMNSAHAAGSIDPDVLLEREYGRVAHLKRKMLADLAAGSKILVRKVGPDESEADFERLAQAVWRHGPSTLLRVTEAGSDWSHEPVREVSPRVLAGSVRRFSPQDKAWDVDVEPWVRLCDSAYMAKYRVPQASLYRSPLPETTRFSRKLRYHRGRHPEHRLSAFTKAVLPTAFDPETIYVFSTWVWIPEDCMASRVFAVCGREPLMGFEADMTVRNRWQRIWSAGHLQRAYEKVPVGIGLVGGRSDGFWSCGAHFHRGRVPCPAEPPTQELRPSLFRRLSRLWR